MIQHLGVIMDGNRRWAVSHGMDVLLGHSKGGVDAARRTIDFCLKKNISYLSLYVFSLENDKRSDSEKNFLFNLIVNESINFIEDCKKQGIKVCFVGERSLFPSIARQSIESIETSTQQGQSLTLFVCFYYGGQQEIVAAAKALCAKVANGMLALDAIDQKAFENCLWIHDVPSPELIIRTGKVKRLSNFLLYHAAYSELCFIDCLWPEITFDHLEKSLQDYCATKRNFGR